MRFRLHELRSLISEAIRKAYEILGVPLDATADEIKKAYRAKALQLHPDRNAGRDTSADIVKVNVAYGLLSDPTKRSAYDRVGDKTLGDAAPREPAWWEGAQGSAPPRPKPRPGPTATPPPKPPAPGIPKRRYFTFVSGTASPSNSRKFWWIERRDADVTVGWGKIGSVGQTKVHTFENGAKAWRFLLKMVESKLAKGYRETAPPGAGAAPPAPKPRPAPPPPTTARPSSKSTYKVYGRRGKAPAHTRYQGQVYVAAPGTRFHGGDKATVALGTDGRLSIHNPDTGHTQHWTREAFEAFLDDVLIETLLT